MSLRETCLTTIADRLLAEAVRNLEDSALDPKIEKRGYLITCNTLSIASINGLGDNSGAHEGISDKFAFCERKMLSLVNERAALAIDRANRRAADLEKFPQPTRFKYSIGDDHCIIWFDRPK